MRILRSPDISAPVAGAIPVESSADQERVEAVENIAKSILQKLQGIEERIKALERAGSAPVAKAVTAPTRDPLSAPTIPPAPTHSPALVTFDTDMVKKGLLAKMWKYLNDQAAA